MRICKIWDADYPWDIRVEKVATTLSAAGHEVHLVCRNQARRPRHERENGFHIHRLPALPPAFGRAHTIWNFPYPANPAWIHAIGRTVRDTSANLILVRDLPLLLPAIMVGRIHRIPVVLDMAENYPAMLEDRLRYNDTSVFDRFVRHPAAARLVESLAFRLVSHIVVVIEESRDRLIEAGVDPARISVVCNTPQPERWVAPQSLAPHSARTDGTHLIYLGNLDGSRGVDTVIKSVRRLKDRGCMATLSVVGDGPRLRELSDLASGLGVADRVTLTGRLPFSAVRALMSQADVGIIPHYATEAWNTTIPNKLFDYMLAGLPVIVSDAKPTARIVRAEDCGEVFRERDEEDLARGISGLTDPTTRREKGLRGRAAVDRRYHWDHDAHVLVQALERVRASFFTRSAGFPVPGVKH